MDAAELTITNEHGELLVKRHYKIFWDGQPGHEPLTIGPNSIIYQDDDKQTAHVIAMPPTAIDWIRARLPIFNFKASGFFAARHMRTIFCATAIIAGIAMSS